MWTKTGNFRHKFNYGGLVNRQVSYHHQSAYAHITEIVLSGYHNNSFQITVKLRAQINVDFLTALLVQAGFQEPDAEARRLMAVSFSTRCPDSLSQFLQAIEKLQTDSHLIAQEMRRAIGIDRDPELSISSWLQRGDFAIQPLNDSTLNRQTAYLNTMPEPIIKKIKLFGYTSGRIDICIKINHLRGDCKRQLRRQLSRENFNLDQSDSIRIELEMDNRVERFDQLLMLLSPYASNLYEIYETILLQVIDVRATEHVYWYRSLQITTNAYGNVMDHRLPTFSMDVYPQSTQTFFHANARDPINQVLLTSMLHTSNRQIEALPHDGANAVKLKLAGCTDVPEAYCCQLSYSVMTIPVYDPALPAIKFEKAWILRALKEKAENPYTRTPLFAADLIEDSELKAKIDAFVEERINETGNSISYP